MKNLYYCCPLLVQFHSFRNNCETRKSTTIYETENAKAQVNTKTAKILDKRAAGVIGKAILLTLRLL